MSKQFAVVRALQERVFSFSQGSDKADAAELAIEYALSARRPTRSAAFLLHDVLRDARKNFYRQRKFRSAVDEHIVGVVAAGGTIPGIGLAERVNPEDEYVARETERRIRQEVAKLGPVVAGCLDGMLAGETTKQSASALSTSASTVDRSRSHIRAITRRLIADDQVESAA